MISASSAMMLRASRNEKLKAGVGWRMQDKRLLICDDAPAFGRFIKNVTEDLGYGVCVTSEGRGFIEAYDSFEPTRIILDMIMPGVDGNELVLWLAKRKRTARVIIITGYTRDMRDTPRSSPNSRGLGR